jgi:hypothetical protein
VLKIAVVTPLLNEVISESVNSGTVEANSAELIDVRVVGNETDVDALVTVANVDVGNALVAVDTIVGIAGQENVVQPLGELSELPFERFRSEPVTTSQLVELVLHRLDLRCRAEQARLAGRRTGTVTSTTAIRRDLARVRRLARRAWREITQLTAGGALAFASVAFAAGTVETFSAFAFAGRSAVALTAFALGEARTTAVATLLETTTCGKITVTGVGWQRAALVVLTRAITLAATEVAVVVAVVVTAMADVAVVVVVVVDIALVVAEAHETRARGTLRRNGVVT